MSKPKPTFTWEDIDRLRLEAGVADNAAIPEDAFTISGYAAKYNMPYATATGELTRLVERGIFQSAIGRRRSECGRMSRMRMYWPK